jgi:predicted metal-dependent hydrolase
MKIDQLIRSKRKTIGLYIERDGRLIVRAPRQVPRAWIDAFVREKEAWILEKQALAWQMAEGNRPRQFVESESFLFLGQAYPLKLVDRQPKPLVFNAGFHLRIADQARAAAVFETWYRGQARQLIGERVAWFAGQHGFQYMKIRISGARTRWGSSSTSGTLSFTWRLVMAPLEMIDYVVVHELVHTRVRNHSPAYWEALAAIMPDYKPRRDWFYQNGHTLTLDGFAKGP